MIADNTRPIRVAQVVSGMVPAGLETWLMRVLRRIDRRRFQFDFITNVDRPCFFDEEILSLGSRILRCPPPKQPWAYRSALLNTLREHGPYDAVHSHLHHFSGFVLRVAREARVPVRIAHCHSDTSAAQARAKFMRRLYLRITERWVDRFATHGLAVSAAAGSALFPRWNSDRRWQVLYCGVETDVFHAPLDKEALRRELGLPPESLVIGHVGTFREPKNHRFLIEVAAAVMAREPRARLLLVSDGPLRSEIEDKVRRLGIRDRVVFTGIVSEAVPLVRGAMDVFLFPSLWEGLPVSVVEAQAAGVPCVLSDVITSDVIVTPAMVQKLALDAPVERWAEAVLKMSETPQAVCCQALSAVQSSPFDLRASVRALEEIYVRN